ncbi:MAG: RNA polymerase factor sigma-54 [Betaproteobacteria bacterium RIFCSPLOWO2_02_FULL_65_24]|nr:MAG: RNA polymerase factor sigma-54 [Betaproteobacteria bacterium RIFCSPLOWO2_02_FULL_65_24]OGA85433.1 MAG: RNA polymerase factor sigma-54 [Betaproteobacteria bacterium RIFCSPLOWO2_12_FULL_66_14]
MKQTLQLKLSQHLTLTPQLQQSIRLLQLSTLELNQELEKFLMDNPLLERDEPAQEPAGAAAFRAGENGEEAPPAAEPVQALTAEAAPEGPAPDFDWFNTGSGSVQRDDGDDTDLPSLAAEATSLRSHLLQQIALLKLEPRDRTLVSLLVDALDEDGYLTQSLEEVLESLPPELEIGLDELQIALRHLQNLEPTGVGARTPAECLELQLMAMPEATPARTLGLAIVRAHLNLLAARDFVRLKKALGCSDEELRLAQRLIQKLNPRPGAAYSPLEARYVVADVIVRKTKNVWVASLNPDAVPRLRVNRMYAEILQNNRNSSSSQLSQQLQEARWLIKNVQQRFETILRVSQAIVDRQRHFFEHGEVAMRPLVLREIADVLGLHESTVSRVTTQKFMFTPRGIFELKYFFGSHVATEAGGSCSATAIRALLKQLVAAEDAKRPLSDSKISQLLGQQGIVVARRTIAKYRESLHIPPVNLRKSL